MKNEYFAAAEFMIFKKSFINYKRKWKCSQNELFTIELTIEKGKNSFHVRTLVEEKKEK